MSIIEIAKCGDKVRVQAHGQIKKEFTGKVIRVDVANYIIFVRKRGCKKALGCFAAHVSIVA